MRVNLGLRLGCAIVASHMCTSCNTEVLENGAHGLSCRSSKGRANRHSEANNILCRALTTAGFPSVLEPVGLSRCDGKRPDGMAKVPWEKGIALIWDFTCVDSLAPSRVEAKILDAATRQEGIKKKVYENLSVCHVFNPIAVETLGKHLLISPTALWFSSS